MRKHDPKIKCTPSVNYFYEKFLTLYRFRGGGGGGYDMVNHFPNNNNKNTFSLLDFDCGFVWVYHLLLLSVENIIEMIVIIGCLVSHFLTGS